MKPLATGTGIVQIDSHGSRLVRVLSVKTNNDFLIFIVIGHRNPVIFKVSALVACPVNKVPEMAVLETIVEF